MAYSNWIPVMDVKHVCPQGGRELNAHTGRDVACISCKKLNAWHYYPLTKSTASASPSDYGLEGGVPAWFSTEDGYDHGDRCSRFNSGRQFQ
eukprot:1162120-Pelagomonas_calceolata.AAC.3